MPTLTVQGVVTQRFGVPVLVPQARGSACSYEPVVRDAEQRGIRLV
jgi:hypothetical protein